MRRNHLKIAFSTILTLTALAAAGPAAGQPPEAVPEPVTEPQPGSPADPAVEAEPESEVDAAPEVEATESAATESEASEPAAAPLGEAELRRLTDAAYAFALAKLHADSGEFEAALEGFERSLELEGSAPYSLIELAEFHAYLAQISRSQRQQLVHLESAADYATRARALAPESVDVLRSFGQVHLRLVEQQQVEAIHQARDAFEELHQRTEGDLHVLMSLAQIYLWQRNAVEAVEVLREADSYQPHHPSIEGMLVEALLGAGETAEAEEVLGRLVERQPGDIDKRLQLAELISERGDHRRAVAVLKDGLQSHFSNPQLRQLLARELHLSGDNREALQVADLLLEEFPGRQSLQRLRVAILSALARFEDAIEVLSPMVADRGSEEGLQDEIYLSRLLERTGRPEEADAKLRELLAGASGQERLQVKVALIGMLDRQDRGDEAIALLDEELEQATPERFAAVGRMLSQFLAGNERYDEASEILDRVLATGPQDEIAIRIRLQQIAMLLLQERWQEVLEATAPLVASDSREVKTAALVQRAEALAGLGRVDEALAELESGERDLEARPLLADRIELLYDDGRTAEGDALIAEVAAGGSPEDLFFAAQMHQRGNRYEQAIPLLVRLLEEDPSSSQARFFLGAAYERSGRHQQAVATFEELLETAPDNSAALNYLGYMWAERGENLEQALTLILRAVAIEPDNGAYVDSLGWVYFRLGRYREARQHLEWAVRLVPDDPTILEHLGDLYVALQDLERARNSYRQALDLGSGDSRDELRRKLQTIEQQGL